MTPGVPASFPDFVVTTTRQNRTDLDNSQSVGIIPRITLEEAPVSVGHAVQRVPGVWLFGPAGVYHATGAVLFVGRVADPGK